ncbi:hypothetical protein N7533_002379 [Penicillium manginii]|uniref:uncharacterized protein n=1 Tax=Penicillium manginii TaxID=203109 RepID=UPI002546BB7D|nr:uncharacterized protein N7533_002379 [Penicillium manginii]KAJ5763698.1 hypothetical protein N7533_002379 [Penicillium manginii]
MFKPSNPMMARLRFTTKQVNGGFYKGNRTGAMGHFDRKGNYVIDWEKVRTYAVPEDLADFKLTPFVTKVAEPKRSKYTKDVEKNGRIVNMVDSLKGQDYLNIWGERNGEEIMQREVEEYKSQR